MKAIPCDTSRLRYRRPELGEVTVEPSKEDKEMIRKEVIAAQERMINAMFGSPAFIAGAAREYVDAEGRLVE